MQKKIICLLALLTFSMDSFSRSVTDNNITKASDEIFGRKPDINIKRYICKLITYSLELLPLL
jgi:hypothetical protein